MKSSRLFFQLAASLLVLLLCRPVSGQVAINQNGSGLVTIQIQMPPEAASSTQAQLLSAARQVWSVLRASIPTDNVNVQLVSQTDGSLIATFTATDLN